MAEIKKTVGVVGLGLIGGGFAKAIRRNTSHTVLGWDIDPKTMKKASVAGAIDGTLTPADYQKCDILLVALYPSLTLSFLKDNAHLFNKNGLVIDAAGIKREICALGNSLADRYGFCFIGGHPMAGREVWGFSAATNTLFSGSSMILTPRGDIDISALATAKEFFLSLGFGCVTIRTPDEHDRIIAYTSQLAHVLSSAYIGSKTAEEHRGLSAGSFRDMTRVATINGKMWSEIFVANKDYLLEETDGLIERLTALRGAIEQEDIPAIEEMLKESSERKKICFQAEKKE